ncbi:hypothetical protein NM688_g5112 [Phlebia brevispora]|uniref:Uncharacterized protein n=1 Tax=Phlebia brevispora TaxID=194682 RepID=A0ACC1T0M6_9APHY|nr:hypothetical protein NM688_g5112 [Phlebia brevispora]
MAEPQAFVTVALPPNPADWTRDDIEHVIESRKRDIAAHHQAIDWLQWDILGLKYHLNATTTIARLPAEVLSEVFAAYVASPPLRKNTTRKEDLAPFWWMKLLHVCRAWRQVAVSCPQLWTTIYPTRSEVVQGWLTLSRTLPLDVRFEDGMTKPNSIEMYGIILAQIARIRYASLGINSDIAKLLNSGELKLDAPLLEDLHIHLAQPLTEVPAFKTMTIPQLRSLTLVSGTKGVLTSLIRPSLTSLTLASYRASPAEFIDILASLPQLKRLNFEDVGVDPAPLASNHPPPSREVTLSQLQVLSMAERSGTGGAHAYLLSHLRIPDSAKLRFTARSPRYYSDFARILPSLRAKMLTSSGSKMHPRAIRVSSAIAFRISLWEDQQSLEDVDWQKTEEDCKLILELTNIETNVVIHIIENLLRETDLTDVTTMHAEYVHIKPSVWDASFAGMRKLEELGVAAETFDDGFMEVFTRSDTAEDCLFPSLKVLKISGAEMKRHPTRRSLQDRLSGLMLALKWRKEMGSCLEQLIFSSPSNMTDKDYETLIRENVAKVVVKAEAFEEPRNERSDGDHDAGNDEAEDEEAEDEEEDDEEEEEKEEDEDEDEYELTAEDLFEDGEDPWAW